MHAALLLSLLVHSLLLSIALGGQAFGLSGLNLPWKERRLGADDLQIRLAPVRPAAPISAPAHAGPPEVPTALPGPMDKPGLADPLPSVPVPPPVAAPREVASVHIPQQASAPGPAPPQIDPTLEREKQNAERLRHLELAAAAEREASRLTTQRQELARKEELRVQALQLERAEAERLDAVRKEARRQDQARLVLLETLREQARLEAARQDAAKQEQARQDALKQEAERRASLEKEAALQAALKQEAERRAALEKEAAQQAALKQEAARRAALDQEAARQNAAKQEAARQEQAKLDQAQRERAEQEAQREERLRAIGKQLNAEAVQRDPNRPSPTTSSLRRGWLFGRADANADLVHYAQAMSRKIEMNMAFDMVRELVKQPHANPVVTVAIRADGSVEKISFVSSSGVPAIDEAVRKVVASQAPYGAFSPALARQYDVIEIRRTWIFDIAIRLE